MKKILVVRFSSIGDIVLTTPVVRCLKNQIPGCEIHFFTKPEYKEILENNPYVSKVFYLETYLSESIQELKKENYDLIIDLHHNLRSFITKFRLGKKSFSFRKLNFEKWLLVNLKLNRMPGLHIVDRYFETVRTMGVVNDEEGLDYFIPEKDIVAVSGLGLEPLSYIVFAIGGKFATKKLPAEKIAAICDQIGAPVILSGGKDDAAQGEKIVSLSKGKVMNACGKFSLNQSASLVAQSRLLITHDTGLMHIGAALKKEIISIWGNTIPEFGMSPYFSKNDSRKVSDTRFEIKYLACRPCSKLGFAKCPRGHFKCMNEMEALKIAAVVNEKLKKSKYSKNL